MSSKTPIKKPDNIAITQFRQELYNGPVPHPDILSGYGALDSSFPERIMKMAENHAATDDEVQKLSTKANIDAMKRGQWLSFALCIFALGACVLLAYWKMPWSSAILGIAGIVQGAAASINRKK